MWIKQSKFLLWLSPVILFTHLPLWFYIKFSFASSTKVNDSTAETVAAIILPLSTAYALAAVSWMGRNLVNVKPDNAKEDLKVHIVFAVTLIVLSVLLVYLSWRPIAQLNGFEPLIFGKMPQTGFNNLDSYLREYYTNIETGFAVIFGSMLFSSYGAKEGQTPKTP